MFKHKEAGKSNPATNKHIHIVNMPHNFLCDIIKEINWPFSEK